METKTKLRKFFTAILAGGATLALGFLSFAGMFLLSSSLVLCGGAFILASAYEGQVNTEGVSRALRRLFSKNFLKKGITQQYLESLIEQENEYEIQKTFVEELKRKSVELDHDIALEEREDIRKLLQKKKLDQKNKIEEASKRLNKLKLSDAVMNNAFFNDYKKQKKYVQELAEEHERLHAIKDTISIFSKDKKKEINNHLDTLNSGNKANKDEKEKDKKKEEIYFDGLEAAKKRLKYMEQFVLKQIEHPPQDKLTPMQASLEELLKNDRSSLINEMNRKKWIIRLGGLLAIGGGVSSFFATFSAIHVAISTLTVLSVIPGGILITTAALAAAGYTLLLYQAFSDMVQEFSSKSRHYFEKRQDESRARHILRSVGTVFVVGLAIFATIATAGTWWYAVKHGGRLLDITKNAVNVIRNVSIAMMALPIMVFSASNSINSLNDIIKSNYGQLKQNIISSFKEIRYLNPFQLVEKIYSSIIKGVLFIGHLISVGLMSDNLGSVHPVVTATAGALNEAGEDLPYMPGGKKQHSHDSTILTLLYFFPVTLPVLILKGAAIVWDFIASSIASCFTSQKASWTASKDRIFSLPASITLKKIVEPQVSPEWKQQEEKLKSENHDDSDDSDDEHCDDHDHSHSSCSSHQIHSPHQAGASIPQAPHQAGTSMPQASVQAIRSIESPAVSVALNPHSLHRPKTLAAFMIRAQRKAIKEQKATDQYLKIKVK